MTQPVTEPQHEPETPPTGKARRRSLVVVVGIGLLAAALVLFQPWKLVVDEVVDEALPDVAVSAPTSPSPVASTSVAASAVASSPVASAPGGSDPAATPPLVGSPASAPTPSAGARTLARGVFISHEHQTSGSVRLLKLADGRRVLRIEGLDTSNGPDLKVWITDQQVLEGPSGWPVFDDGRYLDLGSLKGNKGNQNYVIPPDARLDGLRSVSIWCDRFNVSFGAAELTSSA